MTLIYASQIHTIPQNVIWRDKEKMVAITNLPSSHTSKLHLLVVQKPTKIFSQNQLFLFSK